MDMVVNILIDSRLSFVNICNPNIILVTMIINEIINNDAVEFDNFNWVENVFFSEL